MSHRPSKLLSILSSPGTSIRLSDSQRALAAHAVRLPGAPPPNLITADSCLLGVLAGVEEVVSLVDEHAVTVKGPARRTYALWGCTVRRREADRLRLVRDDVCLLGAVGRRVDGEEAEAAIAGGHDERLRVEFVLDPAQPGRRVGVGELEGLELAGVEAAAADGEGGVARVRFAVVED